MKRGIIRLNAQGGHCTDCGLTAADAIRAEQIAGYAQQVWRHPDCGHVFMYRSCGQYIPSEYAYPPDERTLSDKNVQRVSSRRTRTRV